MITTQQLNNAMMLVAKTIEEEFSWSFGDSESYGLDIQAYVNQFATTTFTNVFGHPVKATVSISKQGRLVDILLETK